ncbi:hypothetical protein CEXT_614801 [Caerostris extrusa]|uniref:Uncharacterized protein n=1 Tax=Caerostris extrusa TaxID=172846 RepID=A0AAV4Y6N2_CAEEX|nr:hypothetical protein CEXT_614801 [Caerostris extrusa]
MRRQLTSVGISDNRCNQGILKEYKSHCLTWRTSVGEVNTINIIKNLIDKFIFYRTYGHGAGYGSTQKGFSTSTFFHYTHPYHSE